MKYSYNWDDEINRLEKAGPMIKRTCSNLKTDLMLAEASPDNIEHVVKSLEDLYRYGTTVLLTAQRILAGIIGAKKATDTTTKIKTEESGVELSLEFNVDLSIFHCKMQTPPILKYYARSGNFYDNLCLEIESRIINEIPQEFERIKHVACVFVSHFDASAPIKRQPYYDNDNLAIKGLWDAIVPNICFDDAAVFCDNIYISRPDTSTFCEIFLMPQEYFWEHFSHQLCKKNN